MGHRVVCISLVTAAGGEMVGHLAAERLGYRFVDDEILERAAAHAGVDRTLVEGAEHHQGLLTRLLETLFAPPPEIAGYLERRRAEYIAGDVVPSIVPPPAEHLRRLIKQAILEIAERGDVVIVAHAASLALAGHPDALRVHVTASTSTRAHRLAWASRLVSEDEYAAAIAESDRQRREYLARFYDVHDESPTHYDLVINTDALDIDEAVAAVVAIATA